MILLAGTGGGGNARRDGSLNRKCNRPGGRDGERADGGPLAVTLQGTAGGHTALMGIPAMNRLSTYGGVKKKTKELPHFAEAKLANRGDRIQGG